MINRKNIIIFLIVMLLISVVSGCSGKQDISDIKRNTDWGMSQEEIESLESKNLKSEDDYKCTDTSESAL